MGIIDSLKGFYYAMEDKWYDLLDALDKKQIPVYKIVDPIDKVIPSFLLFLLVSLFVIILLAYLIRFGVINEFTLTAIDSSSKVNLEGVVISGAIDKIEFSKVTGKNGEAIITVNSLGPNFFEVILSLFFGSNQKYLAIISAEKDGYEKIIEKDYALDSKEAVIKLSKKNGSGDDPNDPANPRGSFTSGAEVELIDNSTEERIVDLKGTAFVKYSCSNKGISVKTSSDGHDGSLDGKFKVIEPGCDFVVKGAYSPNYQRIDTANIELDPSQSLTSIKLTRLTPPNQGTIKINFYEENSNPLKPLVGIRVRLLDLSGNSMIEGTTDYSGVLQKEVTPGTYLITGVSPDGNYYSLNSDANQLIVARLSQFTEKNVYLKKMDPALVRSLRIKVVDYNGKTPLKDVLIYPQQLIIDENGEKTALGVIGFCENSCKTDSNGLVIVTGLSTLDEGKIIVALSKENYVSKVFAPTLFKTDLTEYQTIEMAKTNYDPDTGNAGKALVVVKANTDLRALHPAKTYLYFNSRELGINGINLIQLGKNVDANGEALFEDISKTSEEDYYAKAIYDSLEGNSLLKKIEAGKTTVFDINIGTAVSYFEVNLINGYAGVNEDVNNKQNAIVTITPTMQTNPLTQTLSFDSTNEVFKSNMLDKGRAYILSVSLEGYIPIVKEIVLRINGKNAVNIPMYTDSNEVQVVFKGLFEDPLVENEANFLDLNNKLEDDSKGYYSSVDIIVGKTLKDGNLLGALRVNEKMNLINASVTEAFFQQAKLYSCQPQEKQPYNDDNYYIQSEECEVNNSNDLGKQLGVIWEGQVEKGVYNIITKMNFTQGTKDKDVIDFNYSAKQNDYNFVSEAKGNKQYEVGTSICKVSQNNPDCSGIYFTTTLNEKNIHSEKYSFESESKVFSKPQEILELTNEEANPLTIQLFNNFEEEIDFNLMLYAYSGSMNEFNNNSSGFVKFDSINGSQIKKIASDLSLARLSKSDELEVNLFSSQAKSSSWIVAVAQTTKGNFKLFINTSVNGKKLILAEGTFYSGLPDQKFHGRVVNSDENPVELSQVSWKVLGNCTSEEILQEDEASINQDNKSSFEMIIPGEYGYEEDCLKIDGTAKDPIYEELNETLKAGIHGSTDPELSCATIGVVDSANNTDAYLQFEGKTNITITNNCEEKIQFITESGLILEGDDSGTLYPQEIRTITVIGKNKSYDWKIRNSDILGVFPVSIKAKLESSRKNYSQIKLLRIHVFDDADCFSISKDVFDLLKEPTSTSFFITNQCQYNSFNDYYIPKTTLDLLGVDLNDEKPKYDYIDLNYELVVHGGSYGLREEAIPRNQVMITEVFDVSKIDSSQIGAINGGLKEYKNFKIMVGERYNAVSKKMMFKWIDDSVNEIMGAKIDGEITIEYYDGASFSQPLTNNFEFDSNGVISCLSEGEGYCECGGYEFGPGGERSTLRNGILYINFPQGKVKSVSLNILASPDPKNLFINLKLFLDYNDYIFVPVPTGEQATNIIQTGEFRIYPREENVFLLRNFTNPTINPELMVRADLCKRLLTNSVWVSGDKLYWFNKHVDNYSGASAYCTNPANAVIKGVELTGNLVTSFSSINSLINNWNNDLNKFNWIDGVEVKGFWTNECNQEANTCKVVNKTNEGFNSNNLVDLDKGNINNYVALCEQPILQGVDPTTINVNYCQELNIVCDPVTGLCEDGLNQLFDAFQTTGYIDIINPMTEIRINSAKTNNIELDNSVIMVWIEGGILKAKFLGENYEGYDDKTIELKIVDKGLVGDVYGKIKIVDYINRINYKS